MFARAFGSSAVRKRDTVDLLLTLREYASDGRWLPVCRSELLAHSHFTHRFPARLCQDFCVKWLSLTHRRSCGEDDEVGTLQPSGHVVEVAIAGTDAAQFTLVFVEFFDAVKAVHEDVFDADEVLFDGLVGHAKQFGFGFLEQLLCASGLVVAQFGDITTGADESATDGFL